MKSFRKLTATYFSRVLPFCTNMQYKIKLKELPFILHQSLPTPIAFKWRDVQRKLESPANMEPVMVVLLVSSCLLLRSNSASYITAHSAQRIRYRDRHAASGSAEPAIRSWLAAHIPLQLSLVTLSSKPLSVYTTCDHVNFHQPYTYILLF